MASLMGTGEPPSLKWLGGYHHFGKVEGVPPSLEYHCEASSFPQMVAPGTVQTCRLLVSFGTTHHRCWLLSINPPAKSLTNSVGPLPERQREDQNKIVDT